MNDYVETMPRYMASGPLPMHRRSRRVRLNLPSGRLPLFHAWRG